MKRIYIKPLATTLSLLIGLCPLLAACQGNNSSELPTSTESESSLLITNPDGETVQTSVGDRNQQAESETLPNVTYVDEPLSSDCTLAYDASIHVSDDGCVVYGDGITVYGTTVTFRKAGTYLLDGTLSNGQLVVDLDAGEPNADVTLLLNGLSISCQNGPAVLIRNAPKKAILYTVDQSVNLLSDGTDYVVADDQQTDDGVYPNACIYACDDLKLDGGGTLYVKGNADKGINTKDDLKIKGGTVTITSAGVGIRANDSLEMSGGTVTIPLLVLVGGVEQKIAQSANLFSFLPMSALALRTHAQNGLIESEGILWTIVPALLLSALGAAVAAWLPSEVLRKAFGVFLIGLSFSGFYQALQEKAKE